MPLFHIQDADRPMFVIDENYKDALEYWREAMAIENECQTSEVEEPLGIKFVCSNNDLIINLNSILDRFDFDPAQFQH
jgi:hypothetical protein